MANPLEGFTNLGNLGNLANNLKMPGMGSFAGGSINLNDFANINKLDDFIELSENPDILKGTISKIQEGAALDEADLSGLSDKEKELVSDLGSLKGFSGFQGNAGVQDVADKFSDLMGKYMNNVNQKHKEAEKAIETFASGGNIDVHSVMIAAEKANLSMQLTMQLRNKVVQAYQQIQQIRV